MSDPKQKDEYFEATKVIAEELLSMPEIEILDGEDPATLLTEHSVFISKAKAAAGRKRLMAGRAGFAAIRSTLPSEQVVNLDLARSAVEQALNDPKFTLAARSLSELTDEEVIRIYRQIKRIKAAQVDGYE